MPAIVLEVLGEVFVLAVALVALALMMVALVVVAATILVMVVASGWLTFYSSTGTPR